MSTIERINTDFVSAMKEKKEAELSILRMLRAAFKNKQIEIMKELNEEEVIAVLRSQIKQLKDALPSFETAGRQDLVDKTKNEIFVLEKYLPAEINEAELEAIVKQVLSENSFSLKVDMGKAMGLVIKAVAGRANNNRIKKTVEENLS